MTMASDGTIADRFRLRATAQAVAFWGAIVLPFVYLPMLALGLQTIERQLLFTSLVALNVVLVIVGHHHRQDR